MRKNIYWAVKSKSGWIDFANLAYTKKDAIKRHLEIYTNGSDFFWDKKEHYTCVWKKLKEYGVGCVKVILKEVQDA
jgi:hypothetical protein